ncbi:MAG: hypothetical protein U5K69_29720 [Balneolaceae bacterium]|nr:hypothetical protein [Balneolaceae bacterium]
MVCFEPHGGTSVEPPYTKTMYELKQAGFSDTQISWMLSQSNGPVDEYKVREKRKELGIKPVFKIVDTCAAEFAGTPYFSLPL